MTDNDVKTLEIFKPGQLYTARVVAGLTGLKDSQIYSTMERLTRNGYINKLENKGVGSRDRYVYQLTGKPKCFKLGVVGKFKVTFC